MKYSTSLQLVPVENAQHVNNPTQHVNSGPQEKRYAKDRKVVGFRLDDEQLSALKIWCIQHGTSIQQALEQHVNMLLSQHDDVHDHDRYDHDLNGTIINQSSTDLVGTAAGFTLTFADRKNLEKLSLPVEEIVAHIREIRQRAKDSGTTIGNFQYFVTSIRNELKKAEGLAERYRKLLKDNNHITAGNDYDDAEWRLILQRLCAKSKTTWNEAAAKKALAPK